MAEINDEQMPFIDFNRVCRLCLTEEPVMTHIFSEQKGFVPLPLRVMACASIEITTSDSLPEQICSNCLHQVDTWYTFKDLCESSDKALRKIVNDESINYEDVAKIQQSGRELKETFKSFFQKEILTCQSENKTAPNPSEPYQSTSSKIKAEFVECNKCYKYFNNRSLPLHMAQRHGRKKRASHQRDKQRKMPKLRTLIKIINGGAKKSMDEPLVRLPTPPRQVDSDTCGTCGAEFINECELLEHVVAEHAVTKEEQDTYDGIDIKKEEQEVVGRRRSSRKSSKYDQELSLLLDGGSDPDEDTAEQACDECGNIFPSESEMLMHKFIDHRGQKKKKAVMHCPDCNAQYSSTKDLYKHIRENHRHRCPDCNDGFSTAADLERHKILMGDHKEQFICTDCGLSFDDQVKLNEHMRQKLQCDICDKVMSRPQRLVEHKLVKHNIGIKKDYQCEICGKGFPYATSLRYHKRIHGEKNIICSICGKTFHFLCNYNVHMDLHHSTLEDKVVCELCGGLYPKCKMRDHLARHSKPSLPCELCGKMFRIKSQLKRHKIQYHKETPYPCPLCSKGFVRTETLEAHLYKVHDQMYRVE